VALVRVGASQHAGRAVSNAADAGLAAVLFYVDPADVAATEEAASTSATPSLSVLAVPDGDPLTPGWPAVPGALRINPDVVARVASSSAAMGEGAWPDAAESVRRLPALPAHPVSAEAAARILLEMGGETAPTDWLGYRMGL